MSDKIATEKLKRCEELQIQDNIFKTKQEQLEENINNNQIENTNINTTTQLDPVMKHTEIPAHHSAQLNLEQLTAEHVAQIGNQRLEKNAQDHSVYDLSKMNFEELAVWATHHTREKGDDRGEFGPIAKAMTQLLSIHKTIESESLSNIVNMNMSEMYNQAADAINTAVDRYRGSHSAKPWFKKGKLRAHFCRLVSKDMVDNMRSELETRAINTYNNRINEANNLFNIKENSGLDINNPGVLDTVDKELRRFKNTLGEDGKPVAENPRTAKLMLTKTEMLLLMEHYNLTGSEGEKIVEKLKKNDAQNKGIDRNVLLRQVKFAPDGTPLPGYEENDKWNLAYIKAMQDGSYEAMKPFLEDMFNELMDAEIADMLDTKKWYNVDYFVDNIDKIMQISRLGLRLQGNILKNDEYKKFNDEMKKNNVYEAFEELTGFIAEYLGSVFEYIHARELGISGIDHKPYAEVKQLVDMQDVFRGTIQEKYEGLVKSGTIKTMKDFQKSANRFKGYRA